MGQVEKSTSAKASSAGVTLHTCTALPKPLPQGLVEVLSEAQPQRPARLSSNDEFMQYSMELVTRAAYLLRVGVVLAPSDEVASRGYSRNRAIVVAHAVRLGKLYHGFAHHTGEGELELANLAPEAPIPC